MMNPFTQNSCASDELQFGPAINNDPSLSSESSKGISQLRAPLIMATTSVHRLPVRLLDIQATCQLPQTLSYDEEHYMVIDSFIWAFDDSKLPRVVDWVKGIEYNRYWCWSQKRSFKKILKKMKKLNIQHNGQINNSFNIALAQTDIFNIRIFPYGTHAYQFFALSQDRVKVRNPKYAEKY
ncbi:hypothetical protein G7Z17_g3932 [Cylindrodendrum hubeiense]|uniref:Uncharacterized protein n=1 Tax=Cylindrodendrum hubeiense TaxID=595255 RepID=A0A9P5LD38_9HYPO|nr:hypothetical protein G7Z17_g3932 [Cylindrodendrum hubeiense]